jgi:glucose-6-phosphate isomerase
MQKKETILPFTFEINIKDRIIPEYDNHIIRKLSSMKGQYLDTEVYQKLLAEKDVVLYEVYEKLVPQIPGELLQGLSIVHPGKIGEEYFMTKGHFHSILSTAELYYCLNGHGYMLMETPEGKWQAEEIKSGTAVYVPGSWAHRSINVDNSEDLVTLFCYPADAGHDYATIETKGFRKLIIEKNGKPEIVDNPRWKK